MNEVRINDLIFIHSAKRGPNNLEEYSIMGSSVSIAAIKFPKLKTLKRLAREFMKSDLEEYTGEKHPMYFPMYIEKGISYEKRSAFFATVIANSSPVQL